MKSIIYILSILITLSVWACIPTQISYKEKNNNIEIDTISPKQREASFFKESYQSEIEYILKNFYPDSLERFTYNIELSIDSLGKVTNVNFINVQKYNKTDSLLLGILLNMPKWKPARNNGKNINSCVRFRVCFSPQ